MTIGPGAMVAPHMDAAVDAVHTESRLIDERQY